MAGSQSKLTIEIIQNSTKSDVKSTISDWKSTESGRRKSTKTYSKSTGSDYLSTGDLFWKDSESSFKGSYKYMPKLSFSSEETMNQSFPHLRFLLQVDYHNPVILDRV